MIYMTDDSKKRVLIFVHFNIKDELSPCVLYTLKSMKPLFNKIIVVSNSCISDRYRGELVDCCDRIIQRENRGFDFGAWKDAMLQEGWDALSCYDSLTLMNDTCFGPLSDIRAVYNKMEKISPDFWGITNYKKIDSVIPSNRRRVPEHIQSYFMVFNRNVFESEVFRNFWENVRLLTDVFDVIYTYETQLTEILKRSGFTYQVYIDTLDIRSPAIDHDLATWHPDILIGLGSPFVKIKGFFYCNHPYLLKKMITGMSDYPVELIDYHFTCYYPPDVSLKICGRTWIYDGVEAPVESGIKKGIVFDVISPELLKLYLLNLKKTGGAYDLYITTDTQDNTEKIKDIVRENRMESFLREIVVCENRDSGPPPWITVSDRMAKYDLAGFFTVNGQDAGHDTAGRVSDYEIINSLILPSMKIENLFNNDKNIGILFSDQLYHENRNLHLTEFDKVKSAMRSLLDRTECGVGVNFDIHYSPLMPYGINFWYRPELLKPLSDLNAAGFDSVKDALPETLTVSGVIELMPAYIAWLQGYDFRVSVSRDDLYSLYDLMVREAVIRRGYESSYTWRAGKILTWLPRKMLEFFRSI